MKPGTESPQKDGGMSLQKSFERQRALPAPSRIPINADDGGGDGATNRDPASGTERSRNEKVGEIMDVVRARFTDYQFTVEVLAQEVGSGVSYLREIVHAHYRMSPHELIEVVRLEEAMILLCENHANNLYQLCSNVGYLSLRTFLDAFKRRTGMTPTEWKASLHGNGKTEMEIEKAVKLLWMKT